jgi:hypothetical protein
MQQGRILWNLLQTFVSTGLAVSMVLLSFVPLALAGPKEDVEAVTLAWGRALGEDDPDKVLPHYALDAVLLGTLSPTVRADRAALREYFVRLSRLFRASRFRLATG